jgi:hypothetical protein
VDHRRVVADAARDDHDRVLWRRQQSAPVRGAFTVLPEVRPLLGFRVLVRQSAGVIPAEHEQDLSLTAGRPDGSRGRDPHETVEDVRRVRVVVRPLVDEDRRVGGRHRDRARLRVETTGVGVQRRPAARGLVLPDTVGEPAGVRLGRYRAAAGVDPADGQERQADGPADGRVRPVARGEQPGVAVDVQLIPDRPVDHDQRAEAAGRRQGGLQVLPLVGRGERRQHDREVGRAAARHDGTPRQRRDRERGEAGREFGHRRVGLPVDRREVALDPFVGRRDDRQAVRELL